MSFDLDMKSYSGASDDSAAENQIIEHNSYAQETSEYPVNKELLDQPTQTPVEEAVNPNAENFRAFRQEIENMKAGRDAERRDFQLQIELLKANQRTNVSQEQSPRDNKFLGKMNDNDIPNVAELRAEWEQRESLYQSKLEEMQVIQQHSDYSEVLQKYTTSLAKSDPSFVSALKNADNKALFAYQQGKKEQRLQELEAALSQRQQPTINRDAERMVQNSRKPGTLSQAGGQNTLSKADYYESMSDTEFMKMASRHLESI